MFTGIIETLGSIQEIRKENDNLHITVASSITEELKIDQSVAHDGVCLTVEDIQNGVYKVTAVDETLKKTNLGQWHPGRQVNLERSLLPGTRLDGHFVQGHIDCTGTCKKIKDKNGSFEMEFKFPKKYGSRPFV